MIEKNYDFILDRIILSQKYIKLLEDIMFPVLNRAVGYSAHNELNRVEVFPFLPIPSDISKILDIEYSDNYNIINITAEINTSYKVVVDNEEISMPYSYKKTFKAPSILIQFDTDIELQEIIVNTYINNIHNVLYDNELKNKYKEYISLYKKYDIDNKIRKMFN